MPQAPGVWEASLAEDVCCPLKVDLLEGELVIGGHIDIGLCCCPGLGTVDLLGETLGGILGTALGVFSLETREGSIRGWFFSQLYSSSVLEEEQEAREGSGWSLIFVLSLHRQRQVPRSGGREKSSHHLACSGEGLGQAIRPHTESFRGAPRRALILRQERKNGRG